MPEGVLPHVVDRREVYLSGRPATRAAAGAGRLAAVLVYHPAGQIVPEEERRFLQLLGSHPLYRLAFERDGVMLFLLETLTHSEDQTPTTRVTVGQEKVLTQTV